MPTREELVEHYQDPSYYGGDDGQGYLNYDDMRKALLPHFQRRMRAIDRRVRPPGHLLDVGCAAGFFLEIARSHGWQIAGVEVARAMAERVERALGIIVEPSLDGIRANCFDAATLWEVVEHLPDPVGELVKVHERLRPGGILALSTPNVGFWQARKRPAVWGAFRPPAHLVYFDANTLREALRRAGFHDISVRGVSPLPPLPSWLDRLTAPLQLGLASGQARPWLLSLLAWRALRVVAWALYRLSGQRDDIFTTLEATAVRP